MVTLTNQYLSALAVSGTHAFTLGHRGSYYGSGNEMPSFEVFDISYPADPKRVGGCDIAVSAGPVRISGNYAYLIEADYLSGTIDVPHLRVIDISDPTHPQPMGQCDVSPWGAGLAVSGSRAYEAFWENGLEVIDISNPANPHSVRRHDTQGWTFHLPTSPNYSYVRDPEEVWLVDDISDPANPIRVGGYKTIAGASGVAVSGNYAYVAATDSFGRSVGLQVIDISNPADPHRVAGNTACTPSVVTVFGNHVYAGCLDGLVILDLYQPPARLEALQFGPDGFRLLVRGEIGQMVRLERSRDLVNWEVAATVPIPAGGQTLIDPIATTEPFRFYRACSLP